VSVSELDHTLWQGRIDPESGSERWHQKIKPLAPGAETGIVLLGFACDEGVNRNCGRGGAKSAPDAIRKALANLAWHGARPVYDGGNVACDDGRLEQAQHQLEKRVCAVLGEGHLPIVLGGGHEVAFATWSGLVRFLDANARFKIRKPNIGIINFDAHFDLRGPEFIRSSGTPFAQMAAESCARGFEFHYVVFGINRASNTRALFERAHKLNAWAVEDRDINLNTLSAISEQLQVWIEDKQYLYLSFDIDVLPAAQAPGCSAPAMVGVEFSLLLPLLEQIKASGKLAIADIAEVNPAFDIDQRTARMAAGIVHLLHSD